MREIKNFKTKLMAILSAFSLLITVTALSVEQSKVKSVLLQQEEAQRSLIQQNSIKAMTDIHKVYAIFDADTDAKMKTALEVLLDKYNKEGSNHNFDKWNWQALKEQVGFDVYVSDSNYVITHASYANDIGLDYKTCCGGFVDVIKQRQASGGFYADGLTIEDRTGAVKKYAYYASPDHKHLFEVGLNLENGEIFKKFNFFDTTKELVSSYGNVDDIIVFSANGNALGRQEPDGNSALHIDKNLKSYFDKANETSSVVRYEDSASGKIYSFVPYNSVGSDGKGSTFVLEIVFNQKTLNNALLAQKTRFGFDLIVSVAVALLISFVIARLVARPMYLAFNDLLTGLMNRAGFHTELDEKMKRVKSKKEGFALMVLDLDNFKKVNDNLGHDAGDILLKDVGRRVKSVLRSFDDVAARLGGDEYTVILSGVKEASKAEAVAARILEELKRPIVIGGVDVTADFKVTASIGIALAPEHGADSQTLFKNADIAMYHAKKSGKNAFKTFVPGMEPEKK